MIILVAMMIVIGAVSVVIDGNVESIPLAVMYVAGCLSASMPFIVVSRMKGEIANRGVAQRFIVVNPNSIPFNSHDKRYRIEDKGLK